MQKYTKNAFFNEKTAKKIFLAANLLKLCIFALHLQRAHFPHKIIF